MKSTFFFPIFVAAFCMVLFSCSSSPKKVERVPLPYAMVSEDLFTSFPGTLIVDKKYIVMEDPFAGEGLIKLYDRNTGELVMQTGQTGSGPTDFVTITVHNVLDGMLLVSDINSAKKAIAQLDDIPIIKQPFTFSRSEIDAMNRVQLIASETYLVMDYFNENPFIVQNEAGETVQAPFGKWLIDDAYTDQQGAFIYCAAKKAFLYTLSNCAYITMYRQTEKGFEQVWENLLEKPEYRLVDNRIRWGDNQKCGFMNVAFLKDYIACLRNELLVNESLGRDISKLPRTVYLFDYNGNLVRICELEHPTLRIAGNGESNTLYAINVPAEYCLVKHEL